MTSLAIDRWGSPIGTGSLFVGRRGFSVRRITITNPKMIVITRKVRTRMASTWQSVARTGSNRFEYPTTSLQHIPISVLTEMTSTRELPDRGRLTGPVQFVKKVLETWQLDRNDIVLLLGLEQSDLPYVTDVLAGRTTLKGRDAKDRIAYLIQIRMTLSAMFRDEEVENEWLREPQAMLDDKAPMELLLEGSMENLLLVKEYVEAAAGW